MMHILHLHLLFPPSTTYIISTSLSFSLRLSILLALLLGVIDYFVWLGMLLSRRAWVRVCVWMVVSSSLI